MTQHNKRILSPQIHEYCGINGMNIKTTLEQVVKIDFRSDYHARCPPCKQNFHHVKKQNGNQVKRFMIHMRKGGWGVCHFIFQTFSRIIRTKLSLLVHVERRMLSVLEETPNSSVSSARHLSVNENVFQMGISSSEMAFQQINISRAK